MISQPLPLTKLIYLILFYNVRIKSNIYLFIKNVDLQNLVTLLLLYLMLHLTYVPYLRILLNESHLTNQHIEIVRMFLDSEFFYHRIIGVSIFYAQGKLTSVELCRNKFTRRTTGGFPKIV